jgi:hypothetical protein
MTGEATRTPARGHRHTAATQTSPARSTPSTEADASRSPGAALASRNRRWPRASAARTARRARSSPFGCGAAWTAAMSRLGSFAQAEPRLPALFERPYTGRG